MQDSLEALSYIDGMTIVDSEGTVMFCTQISSDLQTRQRWQYAVGLSIYEAFPNLRESGSTLIDAMKYDQIIRRDSQITKDQFGSLKKTMNVSIPIKANGKIVGAIELARSLELEPEEGTIELDPELFIEKNLKKVFKSNTANYTLQDIIGISSSMLRIKEQISTLTTGNFPVFIYGETGTGKELFAHSIHNVSDRKNKPFVAINCAAIPSELLESTLFGTEKGSFTGAVSSQGLFQEANGGTIYFDEINSMPIHLQSKLLRVLEDGKIRKIGSNEEEVLDVRIISSSNQPVVDCLEKGLLRKDIYYRLCTFYVSIPPLRERKEDILPLVEYFVNRCNRNLSKQIKYISREVIKELEQIDWHGNVRELKYFIDTVMHFVDAEKELLTREDIREKLAEMRESSVSTKRILGGQSLSLIMEEYEKELLLQSLEESNYNYSHAASLLGIPRQTLNSKLLKYGLK